MGGNHRTSIALTSPAARQLQISPFGAALPPESGRYLLLIFITQNSAKFFGNQKFNDYICLKMNGEK